MGMNEANWWGGRHNHSKNHVKLACDLVLLALKDHWRQASESVNRLAPLLQATLPQSWSCPKSSNRHHAASPEPWIAAPRRACHDTVRPDSWMSFIDAGRGRIQESRFRFFSSVSNQDRDVRTASRTRCRLRRIRNGTWSL